jgi:TusA-related sulfurtransferase
MAKFELDIVGKVCPYALLAVRNKVKDLSSGDMLIVKTDHPPAANDTVPTDMHKKGHQVETELLEPGLWELRISIK